MHLGFDLSPDPGPQNSIFALNSIRLDQQSFARRDLHVLIHRAGPRDRRHTGAIANVYRLVGVCILYSMSLSTRIS